MKLGNSSDSITEYMALLDSDLSPAELSVASLDEGSTQTTGSQRGSEALGDRDPDPEIEPVGEDYADKPEMGEAFHDSLTLEDDGRFSLIQPEVIIGEDDRRRITATQSWPWRVHGHMVITFPNGKRYIGTGTMIQKHHVATAGHCVYSHADGGWARSVAFIPGQNGSAKPFGTVWASRVVSVKGWTERKLRDYDYGMLVLQSDVGNRTGWYGLITTNDDGKLLRKKVNVSGYPGDKGGEEQWWHADVIKGVGAKRVVYDIDTMGGQSGSGVWAKFAGFDGEKVCAIHTTGSSSGNGATRVYRDVFDNYIEWMKQW
jgi:glutamyl endopeptidase